MVPLSSFIGASVYSKGKVIGRVTDFVIDMPTKAIKGMSCLGNTGLIRKPFYVKAEHIRLLDRNGVVTDAEGVSYKNPFSEETGRILAVNGITLAVGSAGDFYVDPHTMAIQSISIRHGFIDDLLYGRDIVAANEVSITESGMVSRE